MPTNKEASFLHLPPFKILSPTLAHPCLIRAQLPSQLFGLREGLDVTTLLRDGLQSLGRSGLSRPSLRYKANGHL